MFSQTSTSVLTAEQHIPDYKQRYDSNRSRMEAEKTTVNFQVMEKIRAMARFSQPAHAILLMTTLYLGFVLLPEQEASQPARSSSLTRLLHLASFAFHFGAQMWMTFISGIVLFLTMPRHVFGQVHRHLFPKYFLMNSVLGLITFTTFIQNHSDKALTAQQQTQVWVLCICFVVQLVTRMYVVPPMLQTMQSRMAMEKEAGVGSEVGRYEPGRLRQCPKYQRLHQGFRRLHGLTATANLIALACNGVHLYYLASKLEFSQQ